MAKRHRNRDIDAALYEVQQSLNTYEKRYGMTTDEMRRRADSGEMQATLDVCVWLMDADLWDELIYSQPREDS